jgi:hypothetical protein
VGTFAKLAETRARLGCGNALLYLAARGIAAVSNGHLRILKYHFVAQPVPHAALLKPAPGAAVQIGPVQAGDPILRQCPRPAPVIARRFADGASCFVARKGERLIGFLWIQTRAYFEDLEEEVRCTYQLEPPGVAAWDFDIYVDPEYRFSRVFTRLWDAANDFLRRGGYRWSLSHISAFNPGSFASHGRLGMRKLHTGIFVQAGGLQLALLTCAPFVHVALGQSAKLSLRLRAPDGQSAMPGQVSA